MKKNYLIISAIIALALSCILLFFSWFYFYESADYRKLDLNVNVTDDFGKIGFNIDKNDTTINFGNIFRGSEGVTRNIIFSNNFDYPLLVELSAKGDIVPILNYENQIIIKTGETVKIPVTLAIPMNYSLGTYTGKLYLKYSEY